MMHDFEPKKKYHLDDLSGWKKQIAVAEAITFDVQTDLSKLTYTQCDQLRALCKATKHTLHVKIYLSGRGSFSELPLEELKIDWLEMDAEDGWTGSYVYSTEFEPGTEYREIEYAHLDEMSPQVFNNSYTDNEVTALWITSRSVLISSAAAETFLKVRIAQAKHIPVVLKLLKARKFEYVDIIMSRNDLPIADTKKLTFKDKYIDGIKPKPNKLFVELWKEIAEEIVGSHENFAVHDTGGVHDRNHIEFVLHTFLGKFYDYMEFHFLPTHVEKVDLFVSNVYADKRDELERIAIWLAGLELVELNMDEHVGLLEMTIRIVRQQDQNGPDYSIWANLRILTATVRDDPMCFQYLFQLPNTFQLTFGFLEERNRYKFPLGTGHGSEWIITGEEKPESTQYVQYLHEDRANQFYNYPPPTS